MTDISLACQLYRISQTLLQPLQGEKVRVGFGLLPNSGVPARLQREKKDMFFAETPAGAVREWSSSLPLALSPGLLSSRCPEPSSLKPREHQVPCLPPKYLNYLSLTALLRYLAAKWLLLKEAQAVVGVMWLSGLCIYSQFEFQPTIHITLMGYSNRTEAN